MNSKHSPRTASAQGATNQGRRSFLVKSAVGGVGASLVMRGAEPSRAEADVPCDLQASPLDAVVSLKDSMYELQSAIYRQSFKDVSTHVERTIDYFSQLCDKVGALKAALVAERKGSEYERMKALTDIGCVGAGQIKGFSNAGKVQAQLSSLNAVSEQIRQMAYELLPEGRGVTLSVEATRILREIILLIDQQTVEVRKQLQAALEQSRRAANEYEAATESIQARLSEAIRKLYEPDSAAAAAALVGKAGDELNKLLAQLQAASMQNEAKKAELLIALAEGTRLWVAGKRDGRAGAADSGVFRPASYRRAAAAPAPVAASGELSSLIYNLYPPEGYFKAGKCALLLTQLKVWARVQGVTRDGAVEMVRRGLDNYHITCSDYQGRGCQRDRFIQELANIVLR
ncbi:MAG TPA: hypothetical protein VF659_09790 [Pyrinomonadaceae bacterium]|jgi:hypothetical protein